MGLSIIFVPLMLGLPFVLFANGERQAGRVWLVILSPFYLWIGAWIVMSVPWLVAIIVVAFIMYLLNPNVKVK